MTEDKSLEDFLPNRNGSYFQEFHNEFSQNLISEKDIINCIKTEKKAVAASTIMIGNNIFFI